MKIIIKEACKVCGGDGTEPSEKRLMKDEKPVSCHHCCGFGEITYSIEVKEAKIPISNDLQRMRVVDHWLYWELIK